MSSKGLTEKMSVGSKGFFLIASYKFNFKEYPKTKNLTLINCLG